MLYLPEYVHTGHYSAYVPDHILIRAAHQTCDDEILKACETIIHAVAKHMTPYAIHTTPNIHPYAYGIARAISFERELMRSHAPGPLKLGQIVSALNQTMVAHKRYIHAVICVVRNERIVINDKLHGRDRELAAAYGHVLSTYGARWITISTLIAPAAVINGFTKQGQDGRATINTAAIESIGYKVCPANTEIGTMYDIHGKAVYSHILIASERDRYYRTLSDFVTETLWGKTPVFEHTPQGFGTSAQAVGATALDASPPAYE